jgi:hypothetical protein
MKQPIMKIKTITRTFLLALTAHLAFACGFVTPAQAGTVLNGSSPRPFYVIGHNPNTLVEAEWALLAGANALEPDVQFYDCLGYSELVVYHDDPCPLGPTHTVLTLDAYLEGIHDLAIQYTNLALIVLDVKTPAASAAHGTQILNSIRNHLNYGPVNLNVLINVGTRSDGALFNDILDDLKPREGVVIDAEDDVSDVVQFFFDKGYSGNIGYGDGTAAQGPNLPRALDKAAWMRASVGYPKMVSYVYAIGTESSMHSFIDGGADGIIPDMFPPPPVLIPAWITMLADVVKNDHPEVRMATREDNPFQPALESYGLEIVTSNVKYAGTDAALTFTLTGCRGSATITVKTGEIHFGYESGRMEENSTNWVTIPSADLGSLTSITIHNDGGVQDDWHLQEVRVSSKRWLGANWYRGRQYTATLNDWIGVNTTTNLPLVANFAEPLPTIQCPAPMTAPNDPNQCGAVVTFSPAVDGPCDDVVAVCTPASGTLFPVGQTLVTCHAKSAAGPQSAPCTFTVTVQDTQLPIITCPAPLVVNATSPAGVVVSFAPTATDNCPGTTVNCVPASGSVLAIGDTTVTCTATDASGNPASCSFNVHVKGAAEQTADLLTAVNNLNLAKAGVKNALLFQLNATLTSLQSSNLVAACGSLESFIGLVDAQRNKTISSSDADLLITAASQIRAVIGCTP